MKTLPLLVQSGLFVLIICFVSCKKLTVDPVDTINRTKAGWTTINLNIDYTIQFPESQYTGSGFRLRSANDFGDRPTQVTRKDERVNLSATFCDPSAYPCLLIQYGERLELPLPDSVTFRNAKGEPAYLTSRITFGRKDNLFAVLYIGENGGLTFRSYEGRLYTVARATGLPQHAGSVQFSAATKDELIEILSTITPR